MAMFTFMLTLPFIYYIFLHHIKCFINKKILLVFLCLLIAAAPHVFTVYSMMHTYAGLAMIAIMTAYGIDCSLKEYKKPIIISFLLFVSSALMIDIHLIDKSIKSGLIGKQMAQEAIHKTGKPVNNVHIIIIEDDYPKLSSFCVIPNEAFGWGLATQYETNYQWPKTITDTIMARTVDYQQQAANLAKQTIRTGEYGCVWLVDHDEVTVIKTDH
jgi:hypothetical protein